MFKLLNIILLIAALMAGCKNIAIKPEGNTHHHSEDVDKNNVNKHVLNCMQPMGHHVYEDEQICPIGGTKFKVLRLGTHSTYGRSLDWEPLSYMRFPVPLAVCPDNGFVITKEQYGRTELARIKEAIKSQAYQELFKAHHATYFLYAKLTELMEESGNDLWWYYLNASWEADLCGAKERYKEYALLVIHECKKRLQTLDESTEEYWVLKIIIPNMYRRIGDFANAKKHLSGFGKPALENEKADEFFESALMLLNEAIAQQRTERVPIK